MSCRLQDLPEELLVQVLGHLPKSVLKSARLTCSQIARIGAERLFQRIYFAPRKSTIETFINISSNPVFARNVTDLVYDGRLFLPELAHYKSWKKAFDLVAGDERYWRLVPNANWKSTVAEYYESVADSLLCFTRLLEQQQGIFEKKDDYKALCAGLKNLPNITRVIVIDKLSEFEDHHSCYHRRSQCEIAVPFLPSSWDPYEPRGYGWDARGIQHLIRAVSQHGNHVVQLHIASELSCVPMPIFGMDQGLYDDACRMVRRLDLLKVHTPLDNSVAERSEQEDRLNFILSEAKNLRCLKISGYGIESHLLTNRVWPHLETLSLRHIGIQADDLKVIIQAHKDTLRKVLLRDVCIFGVGGWAKIIKQVGKYLRLRKLIILGAALDVTRAMTDDAYLKHKLRKVSSYGFIPFDPTAEYLLDRCPVMMLAASEDDEDGEDSEDDEDCESDSP